MTWRRAAAGGFIVAAFCAYPDTVWADDPTAARESHEDRIRDLEEKVASATEMLGALRAELADLKREGGVLAPFPGRPFAGALHATFEGDSGGIPLYKVEDTPAPPNGSAGQPAPSPKPQSQADLDEQKASTEDAPAFTPAFLRDARALLLPRNTLQVQFGTNFSTINRNELTIQGLDIINSIFIGRITVQKLKRKSFGGGVGLTYGVVDNVQWSIRQGGSMVDESLEFPSTVQVLPTRAAKLSRKGMGLTDFETDLAWNFLHEDGWIPDMVGSVVLKVPTAPNSFNSRGIVFGSGFWATRFGFTMVKVSDPATMFLSAGYFFNIPGTWNGVDIDPPDSIDLGAGLGYALNPTLSLTSRFNMRLIGETIVNGQGSGGGLITATFGAGIAYSYSPVGSIGFSVGFGLTPESPDFDVGVSLPFVFRLPEFW